MSRTKKRKVKIVFEARRPEDPLPMLQAVEDAFHPSDVTIHVGGPTESSGQSVADEPLETKVREAVDQTLTERAKLAPAPSATAIVPAPVEQVIRLRSRAKDLLQRFVIDLGWKVLVAIVAAHLGEYGAWLTHFIPTVPFDSQIMHEVAHLIEPIAAVEADEESEGSSGSSSRAPKTEIPFLS